MTYVIGMLINNNLNIISPICNTKFDKFCEIHKSSILSVKLFNHLLHC